MKVTRKGKKYNIELDDGTIIKTYDDIIIKYGILYKKNIDKDLYDKIIKDNVYYEEYNKCLNYIDKKLRSEKEIRTYLKDSNNKESIINKLKDINLINDLNYAKAFIMDRINLSNDGPIKIKNDLVKQNIDINIIESEIEKIDNELVINKLNRLITKKMKNNKYSNFKLKQKVLNELINLGYYKSDIEDILSNINISNDELVKKEYDKLYKKYSKKYKDSELEYIIKSKLYLKGFTKEDMELIK